jgi:hypothetical protein
MTASTIIICPTCQRAAPLGTVYCPDCATSLHLAVLYRAANVASDAPIEMPDGQQYRAPAPHPTVRTALRRSASESTAPVSMAVTLPKSWWRRMLPPNYNEYSQVDGVRSNNYYSLRLAAAKMTTRATMYFTIAGVFAGLVFLAVIVAAISRIFTQQINGWYFLLLPFGFIFTFFVAYLFASPWLRLGNRVLEERDELLMRIDTAINTATMAAAIQRLERGS